MTVLEKIFEDFPEEQFVKVNGFDEAVVGVNAKTLQLVYDMEKVIEICMNQDMTEEEALDHYYHNIEGAYVGEQTPLFIEFYKK